MWLIENCKSHNIPIGQCCSVPYMIKMLGEKKRKEKWNWKRFKYCHSFEVKGLVRNKGIESNLHKLNMIVEWGKKTAKLKL